MSKDYCVSYIKLNNSQYLSQGGVSSSSRISRLRYNETSFTPYINKTPVYTSTYKRPVFKKNYINQNTYYPGTREGSRNTFYNYSPLTKTNKIVQDNFCPKPKYKKKPKMYVKKSYSKPKPLSSGEKQISLFRRNNTITINYNTVNNLETNKFTQSNFSKTSQASIVYNTVDSNIKYEGDVNPTSGDGVVDIGDVQYLLNWLASQPASGNVFNEPVTYSVNNQQYMLSTYTLGGTEPEPDLEPEAYCNCDTMTQDPNDTTNYSNLNLQEQSLYNNVGIDIDALLIQFINGNMTYVKETLTTEYYNQLSTSLYNEKCERFEYYENLRTIISHVLESLQQFLNTESNMQNEINDLTISLEACRNPAAPIFQLQQTIDTIGEIRPEYKKYIELYGIPQGGIYDTDKLAQIIESNNA
tara:strand:+ start:1203 stop:2441 length:1239 start_codon:yes stop_codon:yes gene_type:complete